MTDMGRAKIYSIHDSSEGKGCLLFRLTAYPKFFLKQQDMIISILKSNTSGPRSRAILRRSIGYVHLTMTFRMVQLKKH